MKKMLFKYLLMLLSVQLFAQKGEKLDTSTLSFDKYLGIVSNHHPLILSAGYKVKIGKGKLLRARGSFDPKVGGNLNQKRNKEIDYFTQIDAGFKIPTWFGINIHGGVENNRGTYLNPEGFTDENPLYNLGGTINLGKGLFIDQRRASL